MNNICKKSIVISIILLLIGVSISSAISVDTKSTQVVSEECKSCGEVSKSDLIRVERLLNKVEVYSKLLLVLSKYNFNIEDNYEELFTRISSFFKQINYYENICNILWGIVYSFVPFAYPLYQIMQNSPEKSLRYKIASILFNILADIQYVFLKLLLFFKCDKIPD